jgi:hypothetical protein
MTIRKNELIKKEYVYDFSVDGGATGAITLRACDPNGNALPEGFIVEKVQAYVETGITPTGASITFGPGASASGYMADIVAGFNAINSVVRSGEVAGSLLWDDSNDHEISYRIGSAANTQSVVMTIGTEALTAGKIRFTVEGSQPTEAVGVAN